MKLINITTIIALIALLFGGITFFRGTPEITTDLGGYTAGYWDSANGYYIDGTAIIDGSGNITASGTVAINNILTVDGLKFTGASTSLTLASSTASQHITAAQVCDYTSVYPNCSNACNYYLPTAAALIADCLTTEGASKELLYINSGTAASTTFLIASTSIEIEYATGSSASSSLINGGEQALLKFIRTTNGKVKLFITNSY